MATIIVLLLLCSSFKSSHSFQASGRVSGIPSFSRRYRSQWPTTHQHIQSIASGSEEDLVLNSTLATSPQTTTAPADPHTPNNDNVSFSRQTRLIAIPAAVGMLADPILGLIDTAYVGRLGATELAAVGVCTSIFHLAFSTFRATTQATTSLVATANTQDEKQVVASTSLTAAWMTGIVVALVLALTGNQALSAMGVAKSSALYKPAACYLYTRLYFAPVVLYCTVAEGVFRGYSDTVTPLTASWVAAVCNFVLDPLLMFGIVQWGVRGAALATAASQIVAALVYRRQLQRRGYTVQKTSSTTSWKTRWTILRAILSANLAAVWKQMSLLIAWAYATACATRLGGAQVAAHQVGLSVWLVAAFCLDASAVAAQVLRTRMPTERARAIQAYFTKLAAVQGVVAAALLWGVGRVVPGIFTTDVMVRKHLQSLIPYLAGTQVLVSFTLVTEGLAAGANQFRTLAAGTTVATIVSVALMAKQASIAGIWGYGIGSLFLGRFLTAIVAVWRAERKEKRHLKLA